LDDCGAAYSGPRLPAERDYAPGPLSFAPQREVTGVGILIVRLDIADTSVIVLELTLNDEIGAVVHRGIEIIDTGGFAIERDLKILFAGLSDGHVFRVKSHGGQPCATCTNRSYFNPDCQKWQVSSSILER
jgi:hypothetical protein